MEKHKHCNSCGISIKFKGIGLAKNYCDDCKEDMVSEMLCNKEAERRQSKSK